MKIQKENIPKIFKALSSEKRIRIFKYLIRSKEGITPSLLSERLKIPLSTLEKHILKLRGAGFLVSKRFKNKMVYRVAFPKEKFVKKLSEFLIKNL